MLKPLKMVFGMVLLLLFVAPVFAESVDTAWVRRYNGSGYEEGSSAISLDGSGNVYVTGTSTIKYDAYGNQLWIGSWGGNDIVVDSSGNAYVSSSSYSSETLTDYVTIKYYPNGDTAWVRRYNGPGNSVDNAYAIAVDDSGYVYVTGMSLTSGPGYDYATIKYHPNGDTAWVRKYNGPGNHYDHASGIAVDGLGNVYVTGISTGSGTGGDYATIKYNPNGDTAWVRRYTGPGNSTDEAYAIAVDDSGYVYVTGKSYSSGSDYDYATIKYHPNGDTAWARRYDSSETDDDEPYDIAIDDSGNVHVTGESHVHEKMEDYCTIKYHPNGDTAWVRRYDGQVNDVDITHDVAIDDSGNVYVTGYSDQIGDDPDNYDWVTVKYYSNGDTAWVIKYHGPVENGDDRPYALAVDSSGNVYVTGESQSSDTSYDCCTIKYSPKSTDVKDETEGQEKPSEFGLSQNYPNPFNPTTAIRFKVKGQRLKVPVPTTLKIYNVLGEVVRTLVNEEKLPGDYTIQWDGKNDKGNQLASGVYFYELKVGDYTSAKKMVLLK